MYNLGIYRRPFRANLMKKVILFLIKIYQNLLSPFKRRSCVFYPSCSEYSKEAISKYGARKGISMSLVRVMRCHPWQKDHMDPVK